MFYLQSGQLEKALEIMMWVQCSGMKFNDTTYEELIAATEIVEVSPQLYLQLCQVGLRVSCSRARFGLDHVSC